MADEEKELRDLLSEFLRRPGTRQYKWFRPRQAMRGGYQVASSTNHATWALYNNGTGAQVLMVRSAGATANGEPVIASLQGTNGTHLGTEHHFITGDAPGPGQVFYVDQVASITPDGGVPIPCSFSDLPIAVLLPGWSLLMQDNNPPLTVPSCGSFVWEYITIDQLDYYFD